jgi:hypothetical protein
LKKVVTLGGWQTTKAMRASHSVVFLNKQLQFKDSIMKTSILNTLIITAAMGAASGFAQAAPSSQYNDMVQNTISSTSRDTVRADYFKALEAGALVQIGGQDSFAKAPVVVDRNQSTKTRAQVISELRMAMAMPLHGELAQTF